MSDYDAPDGMALICGTCRWRPAGDLTLGVMQAHFETEHASTHIRMELVVLCPRCDEPMAFERRVGVRDVFSCELCHRTRSVRREEGPTDGQ